MMKKQYTVAIVEDNRGDFRRLQECLVRYAGEKGLAFDCRHFEEGVSFLTNYAPVYDVVFLDIGLPEPGGLRIAKKLREVDRRVALVFVTSFSQYAIDGYEVDALDYVIKPYSYELFARKIERILSAVSLNSGTDVLIPLTAGVYCVSSEKLFYVEVVGHKILYHTSDGVIESHGVLGELEEKFRPHGFSRCNKCYLVNLRHVKWVKGNILRIGDEELQISRARRNAFIEDINKWLMNGGRDV